MADNRTDPAGYVGWFLFGGILGAAAALLLALARLIDAAERPIPFRSPPTIVDPAAS